MTRRPAYTLLELMVALGSASVLMVGLSSAIFIAAQGLDLDQGASASRGRADAVVGRMLADARTATRYRSVTPTAIEFDVADRTGDGAADRLRYEWNGVVGGPLTRSLNGGSPVTLLHDVRGLTYGSTTRAVTAQNVMTTPLTTSPIIWGQTSPASALGVNSLALTTPAKVVPGDLLVAMVATTGEQTSVTAAGWTEIAYAVNGNNQKVRLGAWLRTVSVAEPTTHNWYWPVAADTIGGILVVSNHDPTTTVPAGGLATVQNKTYIQPESPSATSIRANSLVLRLGAFGRNEIATADVTGLTGHTNIWARNVSTNLAAGWGYALLPSAGAAGGNAFVLQNACSYATITVVISPQVQVGP